MEELKRIYGICPECKKGYLVKEVLFEGILFNRKKVIIFMCPFCSFTNKRILKLNERSFEKEIE
jgi:hypothetical protein